MTSNLSNPPKTFDSYAVRAYALDTVYQNTGFKPIMVVVTLTINNLGNLSAQIGTADPPVNVVASNLNHSGAAERVQTAFIVPSGFYYCVYTLAGSGAVVTWVEYV